MELDILSHIYLRFYMDLLKRAENNLFSPQIRDNIQLSLLFIDGEPRYIIEEVKKAPLKKMGKGSRRKVLVKWKEYREKIWKPREEFLETEALA
jgi:hypothetical protein